MRMLFFLNVSISYCPTFMLFILQRKIKKKKNRYFYGIVKYGDGTYVSKKYEEYFLKVKIYLEISQHLMRDKINTNG